MVSKTRFDMPVLFAVKILLHFVWLVVNNNPGRLEPIVRNQICHFFVLHVSFENIKQVS